MNAAMELDDKGCGTFRFQTHGLPALRQFQALQEIFGDQVKMDLIAENDEPINAEMRVQVVPGLRRTQMVSSLSAEVTRHANRLADCEDSVCLIVATAGQLALTQNGREVAPKIGDGTLLFYREPAVLQFKDMTYFAVRVPFVELAGLTKDIENAAALRIPGNLEAMSLLRSYLCQLPHSISDWQLCRTAATHIYDLIALSIGATDECQELARSRGLKAARFEAIKAELRKNNRLTLDELAVTQRVSPRYVQMIFEEAGTSYSDYILKNRLDSARCMLESPRYRSWSVTEIAYESGFGDLSYFNRRFKERYLMTPSDLRSRSLGE